MNLPETNLKWLEANTILLVKTGSQSYGTNIATSDLDLKGIAIPPREYFLGFSNIFEQAVFTKPDIVVYDIRKFFKLARDCNPSIIEVLFTELQDYVYVSELGKRIIANKELFLSKRARHTFSGYAHGQLKRITNYQETGNPKLDAKNAKHAMHLVRLMRMCGEILKDHTVIVKRPDFKELLEIRNGKWSYEELVHYARNLDSEMDKLYEASTLRHSPDTNKLDSLCVEIVEEFLGLDKPKDDIVYYNY